jgi:hypothetical protein
MFFEDDEQMDDLNSWYENLSEEEKEKMKRESDLKWAKMENHPLFKKAEEIVQIVESLIECLPEDERDFHEPVRESAMMLAPKFAGVYDCDHWLIMMQSAALMRYHAEYVAVGAGGFDVLGEGNIDKRYVELLRKEMGEYKKLFNEWMVTVHAAERDREMDQDDWGVFVRPRS